MNPDLILNRVNYTEWGCQGIMSVPVPGGAPFKGMANAFCVTLEPDWAWNKPFQSCIPNGLYRIEKYSSPKFKNTYIVTNVEGRWLILFHSGVSVKSTQGCILLGESFEDLKQLGIDGTNQLALAGSKEAHAEFMEMLNDKDPAHILIIGNSLVETELIIKGLDIQRRKRIETGLLKPDELSWNLKLRDLTTKGLISIQEGITQFNNEKSTIEKPAWKKILNTIFNGIQFLLSIWVKSKGITLFK